MYALNIAEDGRVLSAALEEYAPECAVLVETLPDGDISDYKYINGVFVAEPLEKPAVRLNEIEMLRKQIEAQNEILSFYEDCLAEMAAVVYA